MERRLVPLSEAAIQDADMLLWHNGSPLRGFFQWRIRLWTQSPYYHVATAYREGGALCLVDTIKSVGGRRGVPVEEEVAVAPGKIDVFSPDTARFPEYSRRGAVTWALENLPGRPYGRKTILGILLTRFPCLRMFWQPDFDDLSPLHGWHVCSSGRCAEDRIGGGIDPVPGLADSFVTPADLSHSLLFVYNCTLIPDP